MGSKLDFSDDPKKAFEALDFDRMDRDCCETEAACLRMDSPAVFIHDDLLSGNILIPHKVSAQL